MTDHPVGAIRVSVGIASVRHDIDRLMEVLCGFRDGGCTPSETALPALATVD